MKDHYNQKWVSKVFGFGLPWAVTIGSHSFFSVPKREVDLEWSRHEDCHKQQWARLGWKFLPVYIYYHLRFGYYNNPLEIEARRYADLS